MTKVTVFSQTISMGIRRYLNVLSDVLKDLSVGDVTGIVIVFVCVCFRKRERESDWKFPLIGFRRSSLAMAYP
jgi:hypothetical protein